MNERIRKLTELTLKGDTYVYPVKTDFDDSDLLLPRREAESKRICEYILNQEPRLTPYSAMTGYFTFDGSVVGDAFRRSGHKHFGQMHRLFYCKPIDGLSTFEWQHATADYSKILGKGIRGIIGEINESLGHHDDPEEREFLFALRRVAEALVAWAGKCSARALACAEQIEVPAYRENLKRLSKTLLRVPENPPETFYEAVLSIYFCFATDPDSVGTLDRYLYPFYERDLRLGRLTREEAKAYLQELFLMLQSSTHYKSDRFTRGGESHFCIGGYLPDGSDGFTELSRLIVESLVDLPDRKSVV